MERVEVRPSCLRFPVKRRNLPYQRTNGEDSDKGGFCRVPTISVLQHASPRLRTPARTIEISRSELDDCVLPGPYLSKQEMLTFGEDGALTTSCSAPRQLIPQGFNNTEDSY